MTYLEFTVVKPRLSHGMESILQYPLYLYTYGIIQTIPHLTGDLVTLPSFLREEFSFPGSKDLHLSHCIIITC